jgi:hypothetical protein
MTPLKTSWMQLYTPITDNLKLDMRMNLKTKKVSWGRMTNSGWPEPAAQTHLSHVSCKGLFNTSSMLKKIKWQQRSSSALVAFLPRTAAWRVLVDSLLTH